MYALEIKNLTKEYPPHVHALKGISFKVKAGDFYALLGPNGAGKSTTIGIISSLTNKTSGEVSVFGYDIDNELELAKTQIGLVPQEFNFNQFEKVINIVVNQAGYYGVPRDIALTRAKTYLTKLDLWEKKDTPARNLSGGMKRRLMIARALIHAPKLLILDEPTAGVDIEIRRSMWEFLQELNNNGTTIILTTHYLEEAELLCRNIGIISQGELIANTSMKKLLNNIQTEEFILDIEPFSQELELCEFKAELIDPNTLKVAISQEQNINSLFSALSAKGVTVLSMRNKANRLEELFVNLVRQGEL